MTEKKINLQIFGEGDPGGEPGAGPGAGGTPAGGGAEPPSWFDSLPDDIRTDATISRFQGKPVDEIAKALVETKKMVGKKIEHPGDDATEEQLNEYYRTLGRPDDVSGYSLGEEKEKEIPGDMLVTLKQTAHTAGLNSKQFEKMVATFDEIAGKQLDEMEKQVKEQRDSAEAELKKAWGGKYDANLAVANEVVSRVGGQGLVDKLVEKGLGNDPVVIKAFFEMKDYLGEDRSADRTKGAGSGSGGSKDRLNEIYDNKDHPYFHKDHPGHAAAVEEVKGLFKEAYPEGSDQ